MRRELRSRRFRRLHACRSSTRSAVPSAPLSCSSCSASSGNLRRRRRHGGAGGPGCEAAGGARRNPRHQRGAAPRARRERGELTDEQRKIARLRGDLSALRGQFQSSEQESEIQNKLAGRARVRTAGVDGGDEAAARLAVPAPEYGCDRRHSGRQRVHHLHHRHLGQHVQLRLADAAARRSRRRSTSTRRSRDSR